jgi:cell division septation protein DedD
MLFLLTLSAARADYASGAAAYDRGDHAAALAEWMPLAEAGDASAQLALGVLYEAGLGTARDYSQAMTWYRAAAAQGSPAAQNNLALLYAHGRGVPRNPIIAAELWRAAAAAGFPLAQFNLALAYERGFGVARDYEAAARWYAEAGNRGIADAAFALSELYREGRGVPQHAELAKLWLEVARKLGSTMALPDDFSPAAATTGKPPQKAAVAPATADSKGHYEVQFASLPSAAEAEHAVQALKTRYATLLAGVELHVRQVDLGGKGVWYRVLAGPLANGAAVELCRQARAAATPADCLVIRAP